MITQVSVRCMCSYTTASYCKLALYYPQRILLCVLVFRVNIYTKFHLGIKLMNINEGPSGKRG